MSPARRDELEHMLSESEDFSQISTFFFDHFGEKPAFMEESRRVHLPFLATVMGEMTRSFFNKSPIALVGFAPVYCERLQIYHGSFMVEEHLVVFFFCKRINKGMSTMVKLGERLTHYSRISPIQADGSAVPPEAYHDEFEFNPN